MGEFDPVEPPDAGGPSGSSSVGGSEEPSVAGTGVAVSSANNRGPKTTWHTSHPNRMIDAMRVVNNQLGITDAEMDYGTGYDAAGWCNIFNSSVWPVAGAPDPQEAIPYKDYTPPGGRGGDPFAGKSM